MIPQFNNVQEYLDSLNRNSKLYKLYQKVLDFEMGHFIPAVRLDTALFLNFFSSLVQPKSILEIGFGSGLSALSIACDLTACRTFVSLERDKNRFVRGKRLLKELNSTTIELIHCNAFDFLKDNTNSYDFIFLDAVKRDYLDYIVPLKSVLNPGGFLVCDNILFNGKTVLNENELDNKYKTGVGLLKKFNTILSQDPDLESMFYSIGDGIAICRNVYV